MKTALVAINAKYIHANLAVLSLKAYADPCGSEIVIKTYTINQYMEDILQDLYREHADVIAFSCYIWNIGMAEELAELMHQLNPKADIWFGGPEVSYDAEACLKRNPCLRGVMVGEGEATFRELMTAYENGSGLSGIKGIVYRQDDKITDNGWRPYMSMDDLPFVYRDMKDFENKIVYYETSRGCPFACSYCLSSVDKRVRLRSLALVEKELQFFIDQKVPQVKFVDRTFNCNKKHAMAIWQYIHDHDRGITNFHFEIGADLLGEEELALLGTFRPGLVQLEIGVQSTYGPTIGEVSRTMDLDKLAGAVARVNQGHNIHQHLDLIAGLPYEDYDRFRQSFNDVYAMAPEQLQLGFLKVLKGSEMHRKAKEYGIVYRKKAPYEVLRTDWMSYDDLIKLKEIEEMVEVYYNTHQFELSVQYLLHFFETPFDLFDALSVFYAERGIGKIMQGRMQRYHILLDFAETRKIGDPEILKATMIYDLYARENLKSRPEWAGLHSSYRSWCEAFYRDEAATDRYLPEYRKQGYNAKQMKRMTHLEAFDLDIRETAACGRPMGSTQAVLFDYMERDPLNQAAKVTMIAVPEGEEK